MTNSTTGSTEKNKSERCNGPSAGSNSSSAARDAGVSVFPGVIGHPDIDKIVGAELDEAGISYVNYSSFRDSHPEVKTGIRGEHCRWLFTRNWYYWSARGDGVPPEYATPFHEQWGREVRVEGHCMCPSPLEWCKGFAVGSYHIDTQRGLNAFAKMLTQIMEDAEWHPVPTKKQS